MRKILIGFISIVLVLIGISCGGLDGETKPNKAPNLSMINIPPDSSVVSSAFEMPFFGRDMDGLVKQYQWVDVAANQYDASKFNNYYNNPTQIPDSLWFTSSQNVDTIYLSYNSKDSLPTKHLFCTRAIDNKGTFSNVDCRILYRTNRSPDSMSINRTPFGKKDTLSQEEMNAQTVWCLANKTASWDGITISWEAHDPDNPLLMEFKWVIVDTAQTPPDTIRTSEVDDYGPKKGLIGAIAAEDDTSKRDGWITETFTNIVDLETGNYLFIVRPRDDALATGPSDTIPLNIYHPYFDVSDTGMTVEDIDQKLLYILGPDRQFTTATTSSITDFYSEIFDTLKANNILEKYKIIESETYDRDIPDSLLADYNIIYWSDVGGKGELAINNPGRQISKYLRAGGRLFLDARNNLQTLSEPAQNDFESGRAFTSVFLGIKNAKIPGEDFFKASPANNAYSRDLDTLVLDSTKFSNPLSFRKFHTFGIAGPEASSFTNILYRYKSTSPDHGAYNKPCGAHYATSTYQTATFQIPLYFVHQDEAKSVIQKVISSFGTAYFTED